MSQRYVVKPYDAKQILIGTLGFSTRISILFTTIFSSVIAATVLNAGIFVVPTFLWDLYVNISFAVL